MLLTILLWRTIGLVMGAEICYDRSGNEDASLLVCDPNIEVSACCRLGDVCFSNGLCQAGSANSNEGATDYYYNGCTDPDWDGAVCVSQCLHVQSNGIDRCNGLNQYCCYGYTGCNCSNASEVVSIAAGTIVTTLPISTRSTSTGIPISSTSPALDPSTMQSPTHSSGITPMATATMSPGDNISGLSKSTTIGLGAGLGIGVGLLTCGLIAWWTIHRRNKQSAAVRYNHEPQVNYQSGDIVETTERKASYHGQLDTPQHAIQELSVSHSVRRLEKPVELAEH